MRRQRLVSMVVVVAVTVAVGAWGANWYGVRALVPFVGNASLFEPAPPYPGYTWTRDGRQAGSGEIGTIAGPDHCSWQRATFMFIGWPPGTNAVDASRARQYIRDPHGVVSVKLRDAFRAPATLPPDARPTGYRLGGVEVYVSPSDQDEAIYVGGRDGFERWPRSDPMTLCA